MYIIYPDCFALRGGSTADTAAHGNLDTGNLSLEWTKDQGVFFQQIKANPVDVIKGIPQQSSGIGQVCDFMRDSLCNCL